MRKPPELTPQDLEENRAKIQRQRELKFQLWGWFLFIASASFFTASSLRSGDLLSLVGSLFFLGACIVSLIPLVTSGSTSSKGS
ncbi:hypothetical protein AVDCRST_MAG94-5056 [uncultured Leptolyngbya sp.]|uniref:Uncharacterized protein n=1 Tax=uncultured Leptolyngbya sp. TaxID=332963 RepID=A0A6J4NCY6_9CYAN|nr:hypothetical protein AVDCRST_MAG94-5056 [uncultured Leptolyngbya sp.]